MTTETNIPIRESTIPVDARQFILTDEPGDEFSFLEFLENNEELRDDLEFLAEAASLDVGGEINLGGGAAPIFTLRRVK